MPLGLITAYLSGGVTERLPTRPAGTPGTAPVFAADTGRWLDNTEALPRRNPGRRAHPTQHDNEKGDMMPDAITRDESSGGTRNGYHYARIVELNGRVVRAFVERDSYVQQSRAVVQVLNDQMNWTVLASEAPDGWWPGTPLPYNQDVDAVSVLGPIADRLLDRAVTILGGTAPRCPRCSDPPK